MNVIPRARRLCRDDAARRQDRRSTIPAASAAWRRRSMPICWRAPSPGRARSATAAQRDLQRHQRRRVHVAQRVAGHRRCAGLRSRASTCRWRSTGRSARARPSGPRFARGTGSASGTLKEFVGLSFEYADYTMGYGRNQPGPPALVSTIKLMQSGLPRGHGYRGDVQRSAFAEMQAKRPLPPR
mgnify:CR=1 FL=1